MWTISSRILIYAKKLKFILGALYLSFHSSNLHVPSVFLFSQMLSVTTIFQFTKKTFRQPHICQFSK